MNPVDFAQSNRVYTHPKDMTEKDCQDLHVCQTEDSNGLPLLISVWQPTPQEVGEILLGKPVYLGVIGSQHPPVFVTAIDPFK